MTREIDERQLLNSKRKLYKKRAKDNKLIEIGYYRSVCTGDSFVPSWEVHLTKHSFPKLFEKFTKERYYPGWLGANGDGNLVGVPILSSLKEIYVNFGEVVGFTNIDVGWCWYYQNFTNTDKTYF